MPDFTKITAATLDIDRKLYASNARCHLLTRGDGYAGWQFIPDFWNGDGRLLKWWAPYDYGDGVNLRIKIAQISPITKEILDKVEAVAFWRDYKKEFLNPFVYIALRLDYPEIYSNREYVFSCQKLEPFVGFGAPLTLPVGMP